MSTKAVSNQQNSVAEAYKTDANGSSGQISKNGKLSSDSFFKLLAAQLQNQDMSNPMDNSEMMTQMTQIAMMQAMDDFTTAMDDFSQVNTINYGTSMMGKKVLVADMDKAGKLLKETGTVTRVDIFNGVPTLYLDDDTEKGYPVANIMSVFEKGHEPTDAPDDPDAPDAPDATDDPDAPDDPDATDDVDDTGKDDKS